MNSHEEKKKIMQNKMHIAGNYLGKGKQVPALAVTRFLQAATLIVMSEKVISGFLENFDIIEEGLKRRAKEVKGGHYNRSWMQNIRKLGLRLYQKHHGFTGEREYLESMGLSFFLRGMMALGASAEAFKTFRHVKADAVGTYLKLQGLEQQVRNLQGYVVNLQQSVKDQFPNFNLPSFNDRRLSLVASASGRKSPPPGENTGKKSHRKPPPPASDGKPPPPASDGKRKSQSSRGRKSPTAAISSQSISTPGSKRKQSSGYVFRDSKRRRTPQDDPSSEKEQDLNQDLAEQVEGTKGFKTTGLSAKGVDGTKSMKASALWNKDTKTSEAEDFPLYTEDNSGGNESGNQVSNEENKEEVDAPSTLETMAGENQYPTVEEVVGNPDAGAEKEDESSSEDSEHSTGSKYDD